jgi:hypothetical protein
MTAPDTREIVLPVPHFSTMGEARGAATRLSDLARQLGAKTISLLNDDPGLPSILLAEGHLGGKLFSLGRSGDKHLRIEVPSEQADTFESSAQAILTVDTAATQTRRQLEPALRPAIA